MWMAKLKQLTRTCRKKTSEFFPIVWHGLKTNELACRIYLVTFIVIACAMLTPVLIGPFSLIPIIIASIAALAIIGTGIHICYDAGKFNKSSEERNSTLDDIEAHIARMERDTERHLRRLEEMRASRSRRMNENPTLARRMDGSPILLPNERSAQWTWTTSFYETLQQESSEDLPDDDF